MTIHRLLSLISKNLKYDNNVRTSGAGLLTHAINGFINYAQLQSRNTSPPFHPVERIRLFAGRIVFYHDMRTGQNMFVRQDIKWGNGIERGG